MQNPVFMGGAKTCLLLGLSSRNTANLSDLFLKNWKLNITYIYWRKVHVTALGGQKPTCGNQLSLSLPHGPQGLDSGLWFWQHYLFSANSCFWPNLFYFKVNLKSLIESCHIAQTDLKLSILLTASRVLGL